MSLQVMTHKHVHVAHAYKYIGDRETAPTGLSFPPVRSVRGTNPFCPFIEPSGFTGCLLNFNGLLLNHHPLGPGNRTYPSV